MNKGNSIPQETNRGKLQLFLNSSKGSEPEEFLLFLISLRSFSLQGINNNGTNFFEKHLEKKEDKKPFFKRVMHPQDYPRFIQLLNSIEEAPSITEEKDICLRVKSPTGYWKKLIFRTRLYKGPGKDLFSITKAVHPQKQLFLPASSENAEIRKSLEKNVAKYKTLVDSLGEGFGVVEILYDLNHNPIDCLFVEVNPAFENQFHMEDMAGKTMIECLGEPKSKWLNAFDHVANSGESVQFNENFESSREQCHFSIFPFGSKGNKKVGILISDITTDKKSLPEGPEKKNGHSPSLKEDNELLQMAFDTVNQGIFLLKPVFNANDEITDFIYVKVNKKVRRYYKLDRIIGRTFLELNPQAKETGAFHILKQTMLTGESEDFEVSYERGERSSWFKITTRKKNNLLINTLENITRRKARARELKENIRFKKQLIKTSPDIILIFNLYEERIRFINRDFSSERELTKEKIEGMPLLKLFPLIHPQDRQKAIEFHTSLQNASDKDIVELEFRLRGKNRNWESFNARGKVFMRNKKGNVYEYILLLRNVQEQKLVQRALVHAEKLSIKGEIARTLAHELRNPLASIGMSADILERKVQEPAKEYLNTYINIIKRSTTTLNNLVTDLLSSSNYSPVKLEKCCLASTCNKALNHAQDRIYLTGIKVEKKYRGPFFIYADPEKLKIALLNIIVNASEAMEPEKGKLTLDIQKQKDSYTLSIIDNGCGMNKKQLERLFDSFYTQKPNGMGIGLSSVKNILDEHGATIKVESQPKEGTAFHLSFPYYEEVKGK